jgi:monofunctional biosynthetic peptidoglycan transglycosylase
MSEYNANQLSGALPRPAYIERAADGGICLGPDADQLAIEKVDIAARFNPGSIAALGGWEGTDATVGITDSTLDLAEERGENSCSTMPDSVAERLMAEGYR